MCMNQYLETVFLLFLAANEVLALTAQSHTKCLSCPLPLTGPSPLLHFHWYMNTMFGANTYEEMGVFTYLRQISTSILWKKAASTSSTFTGLLLTLFLNDYCSSSVNSTLLALVKWKDFDGTSSFGFRISHIVENVLFFLSPTYLFLWWLSFYPRKCPDLFWCWTHLTL